MTLDEARSSARAVLTVTEVAALLECDERTVRRACEDGQLPAIYVGRRILIVRERLLALLTTPDLDEPGTAIPGDATTNEACEEPRRDDYPLRAV